MKSITSRRVVSTLLFLSAAGCAVFAVGALGVDNRHAAGGFVAMVACWVLGEATWS